MTSKRNAAAKMPKAQFCETFGVSESQLERHFKQGMPHEKKGRRVFVPMPTGRNWYYQEIREQERRRLAPKSIDEARLRTETAKAEMAELDLAERQRETMKVSEHERLIADCFSRVAAKLIPFAARSAAASFGSSTIEECETRIEAIVAEIREELRKADDIPEDELEDDDSVDDDE